MAPEIQPVGAMLMEEGPGGVAEQQANRRATPRQPVEEDASLLLIKQGASIPCRVLDLSLGGCRLSAAARISPGILARVEVGFRVHGLSLRFSGVAQWTDGCHQVGVRFIDVTSRRKDELAELVYELEVDNAAKAKKQELEAMAASELARRQAEEQVLNRLHRAGEASKKMSISEALPVHSLPAVPNLELEVSTYPRASGPGAKSGRTEGPTAEGLELSAPQGAQAIPGKQPLMSSKQERRSQSRMETDTSAVICLVNVGSRLPGRILDLSLGGCRICAKERFPVGIYTRVEVEFRIEGLPFRLGGVIQAIHDRHHVGIRFLDMSERRRAQVEQLIDELEEMNKIQKSVESKGSTG